MPGLIVFCSVGEEGIRNKSRKKLAIIKGTVKCELSVR